MSEEKSSTGSLFPRFKQGETYQLTSSIDALGRDIKELNRTILSLKEMLQKKLG
jgi:hypothetical protein